MSTRTTHEIPVGGDTELNRTREDFHRYAEPGWCEVRTGSLIARRLRDLGFEVAAGRQVVAERRLGLPGESVLHEAYERAVVQGGDPAFAEVLAGGFTGVVGTVRGSRPGRTVALRFDIDANYGTEADDQGHPPATGGFRSVNDGVHHSCGHDGHAAIGLAVADYVARHRDRLAGEIRLIFQPAEEGLRGGPAMVAAGVADGVDHVIGCHIGVQARATGEIVTGYRHILASHKFDAYFTGRNAHAGISPHTGRNAIQAAAVAVQNLLAISRHGDGETRVNVGAIQGGETRNSVPAHAMIKGEIRADDNEILAYLSQRVDAVLRGAADLCGVQVRTEAVGGADGASSDEELADLVGNVARRVGGVTSIRGMTDFKGSDDMSSFMNAVQEAGGTAVYFGVGSDLGDVHHTPHFDIDAGSLPIGRDVFIGCLHEIGALT